jgi:imidazole glycerol-phosphate synthase subunit HisH
MSTGVLLVDYGMANLLNVARALSHCGATVKITENPADLERADRVVVPGVGAFQDSIHEVTTRGLSDAIKRYIESGRPFLGICVGMQLLFDISEEFGEHAGLGILPGRVSGVPRVTVSGQKQRIPHIGWNHLHAPASGRSWSRTLLQPFEGMNPAVYFVHSFAPYPAEESDRLADCLYGGQRICAAVQRGNIMATQFHPERSGEAGLTVLKHFLKI